MIAATSSSSYAYRFGKHSTGERNQNNRATQSGRCYYGVCMIWIELMRYKSQFKKFGRNFYLASVNKQSFSFDEFVSILFSHVWLRIQYKKLKQHPFSTREDPTWELNRIASHRIGTYFHTLRSVMMEFPMLSQSAHAYKSTSHIKASFIRVFFCDFVG